MNIALTAESMGIRRRGSLFKMGICVAFLTCVGCSSGPPVVPKEFQSQIDSSVSFRELQAAPQNYQGRTVLFGGEVLSAKRTQEGTELEIIQLPVSGDDPPAERRSESQGRFLALDRFAEDPAAFPPGTRVTLVGEVKGEEVRRLDESTYRYPTVEVKHLYVWDPEVYRERSRSSVGLFGGLGFGFGGGRSGSFGGVGIGTGY
jgi:outer membrane lipoprotein